METDEFDPEAYFEDGSYPTYEEWKPWGKLSYFNKDNCSYPTYEEWKPYARFCYDVSLQSSYPTYEEWKQIFWK